MVFPVMTINCKALLIESAKCLWSACSSLSPLPHHLCPKSPMSQLKCQVLQDTLPDPTPSLSQYPSSVSSETSHLHFCTTYLMVLKHSVSVLGGVLCPLWLSVTPRTVAHQAPLSMGFPRQEYWGYFPFPSPGDLPYPGIEPLSLMSPALAGRFSTTSSPEKPIKTLPFQICLWHESNCNL